MSTWIIVADSSRARIFSMEDVRSPLQEITDMLHPASRLREQDIGTDRQGRTFDSRGQGRHAKEGDVSIKKQEAINFSREIANYLDSGCNKNLFEKLIIIAPPEFLGLLRKDIGNTTKNRVSREIGKDLTQRDESHIRREVNTLPD